MHAFLIVGRDPVEVENEIEKLAIGFSRLDFELFKIGDLRDLTQLVKLSLAQKTAIVVKDFHLATEEAQNAFLKNLEEPQENLIYVLTSKLTESLLPTVVSRCQVIEVLGEVKTNPKQIKLADSFSKSSLGQKMKIIDTLKSREEAIDFLADLISGGHRLLIKGSIDSKFLHLASQTLTNLQANANVQLQLTNLVVNFGS